MQRTHRIFQSLSTLAIAAVLAACSNSGSPVKTIIPQNAAQPDLPPEYLYAANNGDDTVSAYKLNATTGALAAISGSPFATDVGPISVAISPLGKFLYVANQSSNDLSAYALN